MSAYFSATETAFSTFNRIRMKNLAEKGNKKAALVIKLSENYDKLISTILIGNNIVNILASSLATVLFIDILKNSSIADFASAISTAVLTVILLTFGEISPKTVAKKMPESFAAFSAPLINLLLIIFTPISFVFKHLQALLTKLFKSGEDSGVTEEELVSMVEEAEESGEIDKEESSLIKSAIEFNDLEVSDILTPRIDITAVCAVATREEISAVFRSSGFSRIPVYAGDIDNIIGLYYYKDFYTVDFSDPSEIMKDVIYVAETQKINDLMKELQEKQHHLAVVVDEFGSTSGIITLEDIVEEIVGEIWDEHDEKIEEIQKISETEYIFSGKTDLTKLFDVFNIDEEINAQTVNGWAMTVLGKIPEQGDRFLDMGLSVEILKTDGRRVEDVRITDLREEELSPSDEQHNQ